MTLASPVLGSGVTLNALEAALLISLHLRQPRRWLAERLAREGIAMRSEADGEPIEDPEEVARALAQAMQQFQRYKLPKLAYLGVVVADA